MQLVSLSWRSNQRSYANRNVLLTSLQWSVPYPNDCSVIFLWWWHCKILIVPHQLSSVTPELRLPEHPRLFLGSHPAQQRENLGEPKSRSVFLSCCVAGIFWVGTFWAWLVHALDAQHVSPLLLGRAWAFSLWCWGMEESMGGLLHLISVTGARCKRTSNFLWGAGWLFSCSMLEKWLQTLMKHAY